MVGTRRRRQISGCDSLLFCHLGHAARCAIGLGLAAGRFRPRQDAAIAVVEVLMSSYSSFWRVSRHQAARLYTM